MKKGWQTKKLADVILDIKDGGTPSRKNPEYFGGDVYWCVVKDIKPLIFDTAEKLTEEGLNNCSAKVWPVDSVIISLGATIGQIGIAKVPTATKQGIAGIVLNKQMMMPEFLAYGLLGQKEYIQRLATGATIKEIRPTRFAETIQIPVPPLPEQQRIVGTLDEAFEDIATAKANAEKNLQNARALFESHLQSVFTQRGPGWVDAKLEDVCHKITDGTHNTPTYTKEGVPFLSVKNLTRGFIDFSDTRFISVVEHEFLTKRCKPTRDDILYTKVGTTGIAQVVDVDDDFSIFVSVALLKPKHEVVFNLYLEHFLNAPYAREQAQKRTRGMANKNLVITDIKEIAVHFPKSLDEQRTIVAKLESLSAETQRLARLYERKLAALEALKKSLLHHAFTSAM